MKKSECNEWVYRFSECIYVFFASCIKVDWTEIHRIVSNKVMLVARSQLKCIYLKLGSQTVFTVNVKKPFYGEWGQETTFNKHFHSCPPNETYSGCILWITYFFNKRVFLYKEQYYKSLCNIFSEQYYRFMFISIICNNNYKLTHKLLMRSGEKFRGAYIDESLYIFTSNAFTLFRSLRWKILSFSLLFFALLRFSRNVTLEIITCMYIIDS